MRARIYYRNSTDRQAKARTVASQRAPVMALVAQFGAEAASEDIDEGISGAAGLDERPGVRHLLASLQAGDVVVAFALDRLTRSDDLIEQAAVFGAIQRAKARLVTVMDGEVDLASMTGRIMLAVKSEANAEERRKIRERTMAGKLRAIAEGRKPSGTTPFGLAWSKAGGWTIDEPAAAIVRDVYRRILDGQSTEQIARILETRTDARGRSVRWHKSRVWQTATSTAYRGAWLADKRRGLTVPVPAIVDEATWQEAQRILGRRQRRGLDRTRHVYLAQGLGECALCGSIVAVSSASPVYGQPAYYACARRLRPRRDASPCACRRLRVDRLDGALWDLVSTWIAHPERVSSVYAEPDKARSPEHNLEADRARLRKIDRAEAALVERFQSGILTAAALDAALVRAARERTEIKAAIEAAEQEKAREAARVEEHRSARAQVAAFRLKMHGATPEERRQIVRFLVERVIVEPSAVRVCLVSAASWKAGHQTQPATVRLAV